MTSAAMPPLIPAGPVDVRRHRWSDARHPQILVLGALLAAQLAWLDFGASVAQAVVTIAATVAAQAMFCAVARRPVDWRSPVITGLSLSLLLRSPDPAVWLAAGVVGIGSKFLIRTGGKHIFNPACVGIVTMLLGGWAWVSPGQWGSWAWGGLAVGGSAAAVLGLARRADTAVAFFAVYAGLLAIRCLLLDDPWAIPLHQLQSGALLIFGLFMITDPRSTPDRRAGRILFAALVAGIAYWLQFGLQLREGLFYALASAAPLTPLIDRLPRLIAPPVATETT